MKQHVTFLELSIANKAKYICDISEGLYEKGKTVTIFIQEGAELAKIDDRLWTWKQESFLPHIIQATDQAVTEPIVLSNNSKQLPAADFLILHDPLPVNMIGSFGNIIDFAETYHPERLTQSRLRYKTYRDEGIELEFLPLGAFLSRKDSELA